MFRGETPFRNDFFSRYQITEIGCIKRACAKSFIVELDAERYLTRPNLSSVTLRSGILIDGW